ncbi:MAG: hypothetical protein CVV45_04115 [Spirochaetae bacterium HGW-Spirochaetae-10]|nr:MAG: hypothetical protein CVV45_04115 [Spirochaetae bacterium HGW-Spirochaetae-10]
MATEDSGLSVDTTQFIKTEPTYFPSGFMVKSPADRSILIIEFIDHQQASPSAIIGSYAMTRDTVEKMRGRLDAWLSDNHEEKS